MTRCRRLRRPQSRCPATSGSSGEHRLLCGDATQMADVEKVLAGGLADMVFCDPPYNVNYGATMKDKLRGKNAEDRQRQSGPGLRTVPARRLREHAGGHQGRDLHLHVVLGDCTRCRRAFREAGGHWSTFVIWAKNTFTMGRSDYQRQYEPILYGWKEGTDHFWCGARDQGDVWFVKKPHVNDLHPTMKPVELVERAVRNSSKGRDTVLDPFGGSGTTTGWPTQFVDADIDWQADVLATIVAGAISPAPERPRRKLASGCGHWLRSVHGQGRRRVQGRPSAVMPRRTDRRRADGGVRRPPVAAVEIDDSRAERLAPVLDGEASMTFTAEVDDMT